MVPDEVFVSYVPSYTECPCGGEMLVGAEHRGSVHTYVGIEQIFVHECVTSVEIEVCAAACVVAVARLTNVRITVGKSWSGEITFRKSLGIETLVLAFIFSDRCSDNGIHLMLAGKKLSVGH